MWPSVFRVRIMDRVVSTRAWLAQEVRAPDTQSGCRGFDSRTNSRRASVTHETRGRRAVFLIGRRRAGLAAGSFRATRCWCMCSATTALSQCHVASGYSRRRFPVGGNRSRQEPCRAFRVTIRLGVAKLVEVGDVPDDRGRLKRRSAFGGVIGDMCRRPRVFFDRITGLYRII